MSISLRIKELLDYYSESSDVFCSLRDLYSSDEPERPLLSKSQVAAAIYIISAIDYSLKDYKVCSLFLDRKEAKDNIHIILSDGCIIEISDENIRVKPNLSEESFGVSPKDGFCFDFFNSNFELVNLLESVWRKVLKEE